MHQAILSRFAFRFLYVLLILSLLLSNLNPVRLTTAYAKSADEEQSADLISSQKNDRKLIPLTQGTANPVYQNEPQGYELSYPEGWYVYPSAYQGRYTGFEQSLITSKPLVPNSDGTYPQEYTGSQVTVAFESNQLTADVSLAHYVETNLSSPYFMPPGTPVTYGDNHYIELSGELGRTLYINQGANIYSFFIPRENDLTEQGLVESILASFKPTVSSPLVTPPNENPFANRIPLPQDSNSSDASAQAFPDMKMPWNSANTYNYNSGPHGAGDTNYGNCYPYSLTVLAGLDFGLNSTSIEVLAVAPGTITYYSEGTNGGMGNYVRVDHGDNWATEYWHLSSIDQWVKDNLNRSNAVAQGQVLGKAGGTGGPGSGWAVHLHLQLRNNGSAYGWDGLTIDGYKARSIYYATDTSKGLNYQGTLTKGSETLGTTINYGCNTTTRLGKKWTGSSGTIEAIGGPVYSTNTRRYGGGGGVIGNPMPSGTTKCADEGGYCSVPGTATVYYGANNSYLSIDNVNGGITCSNDAFHNDPAYGVGKSCYYKLNNSGSNCPNYSYDGVVLFENKQCNYSGGAKAEFSSEGPRNTPELGMNDNVSSIHVGPGWSAKVYEHDYGNGSWRCWTSTPYDLSQDWYDHGNTGQNIDNTISSVEVFHNTSCSGTLWGKAYLYDLTSYNGSSASYSGAGLWQLEGSANFNDRAESILLPKDWSARLYADNNRSNASVCLQGNDANLLDNSYNTNGSGVVGNTVTWIDIYNQSTCPALLIAPPQPSLVSPDPNATINRNSRITLSWNSISGASYKVKFWGALGTNIETDWMSETSYFVGDSFYAGTYYWQVQAQNGAGPSPWSEVRTLYIKYGTPGSLSVSGVTQSQASLSWSASADAPGNIDGYHLYRDGSLIQTVGSTQTTYTDSGLSCGRSYSYTVKAYKGGLESDASNSAVASTGACAAGIPQLVSPDNQAVFDEGQSITLSWTRTGDTFYGEIWGGPGGTGTFGWQAENSLNIGPQWAGYTYSWHIKAKSAGPESAYSSTRSFTIRPGQPGTLSATNTCAQANLSWGDNSGSEQGYKVYRAGVLVATLASNSTSYSESINGGSTYTYTVTAYRGTIESAASNEISVSPPYCAPGNDNRANAYGINSVPYTVSEFTGGATLEASEPVYRLGWNNSASVWFSFSPSAAGTYAIDTSGSSYDTVLHLFEQDASGNLTYLKGNDDDSGTVQSKFLFTAKANTTYLIGVTRYGGVIGGSLVFNVTQVPCPTGNLCLTVTNPYYRPFDGQIALFQGSSRVSRVTLDPYGYISVPNVSGQYAMYVFGRYMIAEVDSVQAPGYAQFSGVGLPSITLRLKDAQSTPVKADFYMKGKYTHMWVGSNETADMQDAVYATPGTFELIAIAQEAKIMAVTNMVVAPGMDATPLVYDIAEWPARTFAYHISTIPNVYPVFWTPGGYGWGLNVTDGQTVTISMSGNQSYYMENIVEMDDPSDTGYWQYIIPGGNVQVRQFRENQDVNIGGNLRIQPWVRSSPVGAGDTAAFDFGITDGSWNTITSMQFYATSGAAALALPEAPDPKGNSSAGQQSPAAGFWRQDGALRLSDHGTDLAGVTAQEITPIVRTLEILNPIDVPVAQETLPDNGGTYSYPVTDASPLGTWTARINVNHLGSWPSQPGSTTFVVKNTPAPANDDFYSAQEINSNPFGISLDTFGATQAPDDPDLSRCDSSPALATVWYRYTATQDGAITVDTSGSDYDTIIGVWTGSRGTLVLEGCNDDRIVQPRDQDSEMVLTVRQGITYYIMAGKWVYLPPQATSMETKDGLSMQTAGAGMLELHVRFSASLPGAPELVSPTGTIVTRTTAFQWNKVDFGVDYKLRVLNADGDEVYQQTLAAMNVCQGTSCSAIVPFQFANGNYQWQMQAQNISGAGPWSSLMSFSVLSTAPVDCYDLNLGISPQSAGEVSRSPEFNCNAGRQYISGSLVTLQAQPNPGFDFVGWMGALTGSQPTGQVFTTSHVSIIAQFMYRAPGLQSITPTEALSGSAQINLVVTGADFTNASKVRWNSVDLATAYESDTRLTALVPASLLTTAGTANVTVFNPTPGGGESSSLAFTIKNKIPTLAGLNPTTKLVDDPAFNLIISGSNFVTGAQVKWNGNLITPATISSTQIIASIPASYLTAPGTISIRVTNPAPTDGDSNALTLSINNRVPSITSLQPNSTLLNSPDTEVTVTGASFANGAVVRWNGADLSTTYISATQLKAVLPASRLTNAAAASITVFNPAPGGGISNELIFIVQNPLPVLNSTAPDQIQIWSNAFTLTVNGSSFLPSSVVRWNGETLDTTYSSAGQLTALVPASRLNTAGTAAITVYTPAPGGGSSSSLAFTMLNRQPVITSINPGSALVGSGPLTLIVTGANFVSGAAVKWGPNALTTTFVSASELRVTVPAAYLTSTAAVNVTASNPAPGGGVSPNYNFNVNNPAPVMAGLSPNQMLVGSGDFTLTVSGSAFVSGSVVRWNGNNLPTSYVSPNQLTANVAGSRIASIGSAQITVYNPGPGGGISGALSLDISPENPMPTLTSLAPASLTAGGAAFTLQVNGVNFASSSVIEWDGEPLTTTFINSTKLSASVPAGKIVIGSELGIQVRTPNPGGGLSEELTLEIRNPQPHITQVTADADTVNKPIITLRIQGDGFNPDTTITIGGETFPIVWVSKGELTLPVPRAALEGGKKISLAAVNGLPGGGASASVEFSLITYIYLPAILRNP